MKLTKSKLKRIIKEELQRVMLEEGVMDKLRDMGQKAGRWLSGAFAGPEKKMIMAVEDSLKELFTDEELASLYEYWNAEAQKEGKTLDDFFKEWIKENIKVGRSGENRNQAETVREILYLFVAWPSQLGLKSKIAKYGKRMKDYTNSAIKSIGNQDMKTGTYHARN
jgi:hypothetical protein